MMAERLLSTTRAAALAGVAPSTIKRWADQGLLAVARTAGGHRRIERTVLDRFLREQAGSGPLDEWIRFLVGGRRHEIDGGLLAARNRLGAWYRVADELGAVLGEVGRRWKCGELTVADEHLASDCLVRSLARVGDSLPGGAQGPRCLLAAAGDDEHTLGLSLAELCLREVGWTPLWLGRRTPLAEIVRVVDNGTVAMVALAASVASRDRRALSRHAGSVGKACARRGVALVLGGSGAWPARPTHGVRLTSFAAFHAYVVERS